MAQSRGSFVPGRATGAHSGYNVNIDRPAPWSPVGGGPGIERTSMTFEPPDTEKIKEYSRNFLKQQKKRRSAVEKAQGDLLKLEMKQKKWQFLQQRMAAGNARMSKEKPFSGRREPSGWAGAYALAEAYDAGIDPRGKEKLAGVIMAAGGPEAWWATMQKGGSGGGGGGGRGGKPVLSKVEQSRMQQKQEELGRAQRSQELWKSRQMPPPPAGGYTPMPAGMNPGGLPGFAAGGGAVDTGGQATTAGGQMTVPPAGPNPFQSFQPAPAGGLARGTLPGTVPKTGEALIHEGEAIVPQDQVDQPLLAYLRRDAMKKGVPLGQGQEGYQAGTLGQGPPAAPGPPMMRRMGGPPPRPQQPMPQRPMPQPMPQYQEGSLGEEESPWPWYMYANPLTLPGIAATEIGDYAARRAQAGGDVSIPEAVGGGLREVGAGGLQSIQDVAGPFARGLAGGGPLGEEPPTPVVPEEVEPPDEMADVPSQMGGTLEDAFARARGGDLGTPEEPLGLEGQPGEYEQKMKEMRGLPENVTARHKAGMNQVAAERMLDHLQFHGHEMDDNQKAMLMGLAQEKQKLANMYSKSIGDREKYIQEEMKGGAELQKQLAKIQVTQSTMGQRQRSVEELKQEHRTELSILRESATTVRQLITALTQPGATARSRAQAREELATMVGMVGKIRSGKAMDAAEEQAIVDKIAALPEEKREAAIVELEEMLKGLK